MGYPQKGEIIMADEKVLIVDDDPAIRKLLTKVVEGNGFKSMTAASGQEAVALAQNRKFDLILLDIMMNGVDDGFDAIRSLRATGNDIPIVILSGRTEDFDTLYGLDIGADDYITKPFNPVVLGAKIKALIRRNKKAAYNAHNFITAGPFRYSNMTLEFFKNEQLIPLSSKENVMMKLFISNVGRVFTKEQLYELVWGNSIVDENAIMVYISHLRNKIEDNPKSPRYIKNVWGLGYKFTVNEGE